MIESTDGWIFVLTSWTSLKAQASARLLSIQYDSTPDQYSIFVIDERLLYYTVIFRGAIPASSDYGSQAANDIDKTDFETNYQPTANKRIAPRFYDSDSGGGDEQTLGVVLRKSASGGSVELGTGTNPIRSDPTGTTTQPVSGSVAVTGTVTTTNASVGSNTAAIPTSSTQIGGSDGTNLQAARVFDGDSGAGTQYVLGSILRKSASGGTVEAGTSSDPIRVDPTGTTTQPVSGTVTANIGTSGSLALDASITAQSLVDNNPFTDGTTRVQPIAFIFDETAGTALTENDAAAARIDSKRAQISVIEDATNRGTRAAVKAASSAAVAADPALVVAVSPNNTVSIAGTKSNNGGVPGATNLGVLPAVATAAAPTYTEGNQVGLSTDLAGAVRISGSISATNPSVGTNSAAIPTSSTQIGGSDGTNLQAARVFDGDTGGGTQYILGVGLRKSASGGTVEAGTLTDPLRTDPTGTTTQPVSGTVTANIGTSGSLALDASITAQSLVDNNPFTDGTTRVQPIAFILDEVAGTALTENDAAAARIDSKRAQVTVLEDATTRGTRATIKAASTAAVATDPALVVAVSPNNTVTVTGTVTVLPPGSGSGDRGFIIGYVATSTTTFTSVRATTYTEQSSNAQRSLVSSSASDASAGTGARTVIITYYTSTGTGPFTETVTLNGTTPVNTVSTTICFIEKMEVATVGSTGSNVGIISLKAATGGGGATVWSIAVTDNKTFGAHHYVATGKTIHITGASAANNSTVVGGGALFVIKSIPIGVSNVPEVQISDFIRLYGQSSIITRVYGTAIEVVGPAKLTMYVTPESSASFVQRGWFDYYED